MIVRFKHVVLVLTLAISVKTAATESNCSMTNPCADQLGRKYNVGYLVHMWSVRYSNAEAVVALRSCKWHRLVTRRCVRHSVTTQHVRTAVERRLEYIAC